MPETDRPPPTSNADVAESFRPSALNRGVRAGFWAFWAGAVIAVPFLRCPMFRHPDDATTDRELSRNAIERERELLRSKSPSTDLIFTILIIRAKASGRCCR